MSDQMSIQHMLRTVKADGCPDEKRDFGRAFERWWFAQYQAAHGPNHSGAALVRAGC